MLTSSSSATRRTQFRRICDRYSNSGVLKLTTTMTTAIWGRHSSRCLRVRRHLCRRLKLRSHRARRAADRAVSRAAPQVDNMHFVSNVHTARLTARRRTETMSSRKKFDFHSVSVAVSCGRRWSRAIENGKLHISYVVYRWLSSPLTALCENVA